MKMSKAVQRLNTNLLQVLAQINEEAQQIDGFSHLEHTVKFDAFPGSLLVLCHFKDMQSLQNGKDSQLENKLQNQLHKLLLKKGIVLKKPKMNLKFHC